MPLSPILGLLLACDGAQQAPAPVEDPCPEISMEMAGDWIKVQGSAGDHTHRVRIHPDGSAWYVGGGFEKTRMEGKYRKDDLMLTEVGDKDLKTRLYFQPNKKKCSVRVVEVRVDAEGKERQVGVGYTEYLSFPEGQVFTFRPCDDSAYIGDAAKSWAKARRERDSDNGINPVGALGESVPVASWTEPIDGECTYSAALYFDDRPVEGKEALEGKLSDGMVQFYDEWYAPYSGNHNFEFHRKASCGGEDKDLGVACLEAILD
ncbi:MAG TPA: hypothetical protein QGF58_06915 [Myxococcota bacterium]|nr:hypothetical protein [Myxococcota bacterium]